MTTRIKRSLAISVHTNTSTTARNEMYVDRSFTSPSFLVLVIVQCFIRDVTVSDYEQV